MSTEAPASSIAQPTVSTAAASVAPLSGPSAHALAPEKYVELGMPSPERAWHGPDYEAAGRALTEIAATAPGTLPRLQGPSKPVFDRMVDERNLDFLRNKRTPLPVRVDYVLKTMNGSGLIFRSYMNRLVAGDDVLRETIAIQAYALVVGAVQWEVLDDLVPTLDKNAPDYPTRMSGMKQVENGTNDMVFGCLISLSALDPENQTWFARKLQTALPPLLIRLTELNAKEAVGKVTTLRDQQQETIAREALDGLVTALRNAPRHGPR